MKLSDVVIGASEVGAIMGIDSFRSPLDVWSEKTGRKERDGDSDASFHGTHLEAGVASMFAARHGVVLREWESEFSPTHKWLRATPDRVLLYRDMPDEFRRRHQVQDGECILLEIKTTGLASFMPPSVLAQEWGADGSDAVPAKYRAQVHTQVHVMDEVLRAQNIGWCSRAWLKALIPGRGSPEFVINANPDTTEEILRVAHSFVHERLVADVPPDPRDADDWSTLATALTRKKLRDDILVADADADLLMRTYDAARAMEKDGAALKAEARAKLALLIGDAYGVQGDVGRCVYSSGKEAPTLSKANLADAIVDLLRNNTLADEMISLAYLRALVEQNTRTVVTKRRLTVKLAGSDDDE